MLNLVDKIKDLVLALESKISDVNAKEQGLDELVAKNKELYNKNMDYSSELSAREKRVSHIEDVARVSEESKERLKQANNIKIDNDKKHKELLDIENNLKAKNEELQKMISLYRSKNQSLEEEKVQLEKDRKEMRIKIIEDLKKLK